MTPERSPFPSLGAGGSLSPISPPSALPSAAPPPYEDASKNDIAAALIKKYAHAVEFIDNSVLGMKATTDALAKITVIKMTTTRKSAPSEWEKLPEEVGYSAFTVTQPERVDLDVDSVAVRIEKRELVPMLPMQHALAGRRMVFVGQGDQTLTEGLASLVWTHYAPSYHAMIFSPVSGCEWAEFYLMVEVSEREIEHSFPGLTTTSSWASWKEKIAFQVARRTS